VKFSQLYLVEGGVRSDCFVRGRVVGVWREGLPVSKVMSSRLSNFPRSRDFERPYMCKEVLTQGFEAF
jgi:hypothetical protein